MTTSQALAAAARHLAPLFEHDLADLTEPRDVVISIRARNQVMASLQVSLSHLVPPRHPKVESGPMEIVSDPVRGLAEALKRRPIYPLEGPSPTDVLTSPPSHPAARAWAGAAAAMEAAAVQVTRARAREVTTTHLADGTPADLGAGADHHAMLAAVRQQHGAWAMTADLAGLSDAVAVLDVRLAEAALTSAETLTGAERTALVQAASTLRQHGDDVRLTADLVLRLSENGSLASGYDLAVRRPGPFRVDSVWHVPVALRRARELLETSPPLTGPQHRQVAAAVAKAARAMAAIAPPTILAQLEDLASAELKFAAQWTANTIVARTVGDATPQLQLTGVLDTLRDLPASLSTADSATRAVWLQRAVWELAGVANAAEPSLAKGFIREAYLVRDELNVHGWAPPRPAVAARKQAEQLAVGVTNAARRLTDVARPNGAAPVAAAPMRALDALPPRTGPLGIRPAHPSSAVRPAAHARRSR